MCCAAVGTRLFRPFCCSAHPDQSGHVRALHPWLFVFFLPLCVRRPSPFHRSMNLPAPGQMNRRLGGVVYSRSKEFLWRQRMPMPCMLILPAFACSLFPSPFLPPSPTLFAPIPLVLSPSLSLSFLPPPLCLSLPLSRFVPRLFFCEQRDQLLAKELVQSRNAKNRMYEGKAQLHSVQMQLQNQLGEQSRTHDEMKLPSDTHRATGQPQSQFRRNSNCGGKGARKMCNQLDRAAL